MGNLNGNEGGEVWRTKTRGDCFVSLFNGNAPAPPLLYPPAPGARGRSLRRAACEVCVVVGSNTVTTPPYLVPLQCPGRPWGKVGSSTQLLAIMAASHLRRNTMREAAALLLIRRADIPSRNRIQIRAPALTQQHYI
jgi:hypothetical protein